LRVSLLHLIHPRSKRGSELLVRRVVAIHLVNRLVVSLELVKLALDGLMFLTVKLELAPVNLRMGVGGGSGDLEHEFRRADTLGERLGTVTLEIR
jgi:hypothetical protein